MMCGWYTLDFLNQTPDLLDDFKKIKTSFRKASRHIGFLLDDS